MRRRPFAWLAVVLSAACTAGLAGQAPAPSAALVAPATLLIRDTTVIDGTGAAPRMHADLMTRGGRIVSVSDTSLDASADIVVNGGGLFVIPGLFDAHVHLSGSPWNERVEELKRVLAGGVTAVYDVAGDVRQTGDLARAVIAGEIDGPSIYYCALVSGPAFFSDPRVVSSSLGFTPGEAPWAREVTPGTDMARTIAEARGSGATGLKIYAALDAAQARRVIEEAARQGLKTVAHATVFPAKPSDLISAGVNMLAHSAYLVWEGSAPSDDFKARARGPFSSVPPDGDVMTRLLQSMHDRDVALNPTLWIFSDGPARDQLSATRTPWMNAVTRRAADLGVQIVAGTDDMLDPAVDRLPILHRELEALVTGAGLTPMQAIVSATRNAAHAVGADTVRGSIAPGLAAELVLLDRNPAEDIRNTRAIRYVVKDGRIAFDRAAAARH